MPTGSSTSGAPIRADEPSAAISAFTFSATKPEYLKTARIARLITKLHATHSFIFVFWPRFRAEAMSSPLAYVTPVENSSSSAYFAFQQA